MVSTQRLSYTTGPPLPQKAAKIFLLVLAIISCLAFRVKRLQVPGRVFALYMARIFCMREQEGYIGVVLLFCVPAYISSPLTGA